MRKFLYLRTDICANEITLGGSVGHTLGVLQGFQMCKYQPIVFSSAIQSVLKKKKYTHVYVLKPLPVFLLRWRFNYLRWRLECFLSTLIFSFTVLGCWKHSYVFVYQRYSILNFSGVLLSLFKGIPLVLEYNGSDAYWFDKTESDPWYERWFCFRRLSYGIERYNVKKAHTIIAVSQALKDDLIKQGIKQEKILVNPNGVDATVFDSSLYKEEKIMIRETYSLESKFVFGFIGTFGFWHGIEVLEKLIPEVVDKNQNVHFLLVGDGALKAGLEEKIRELGLAQFVTFTGKIAQDKAPHYLAVCDAFLCPTQPNKDGTRFFGSPTKLFEYMSMAKPVIASELEQLSEVISPAVRVNKDFLHEYPTITNELGFLVDPLDSEGFVKACLLCAQMPEQDRAKMGVNARAKVLQQYTWEQHVKRIIDHAQL